VQLPGGIKWKPHVICNLRPIGSRFDSQQRGEVGGRPQVEGSGCIDVARIVASVVLIGAFSDVRVVKAVTELMISAMRYNSKIGAFGVWTDLPRKCQRVSTSGHFKSLQGTR
jgi:hypothetical protein